MQAFDVLYKIIIALLAFIITCFSYCNFWVYWVKLYIKTNLVHSSFKKNRTNENKGLENFKDPWGGNKSIWTQWFCLLVNAQPDTVILTLVSWKFNEIFQIFHLISVLACGYTRPRWSLVGGTVEDETNNNTKKVNQKESVSNLEIGLGWDYQFISS